MGSLSIVSLIAMARCPPTMGTLISGPPRALTRLSQQVFHRLHGANPRWEYLYYYSRVKL
jgi:hypothetical protein